MSSIFESFLSTAEVQTAFGEQAFVAAMLRFEAALARADGRFADLTGERAFVLCPRGVARLDPRSGRTTSFTAADGLHGDIVDLMSSHRAADGTLYVGGPGGYTAFDPAAARPSADRPPVRISSVEVGGRGHAGEIANGRKKIQQPHVETNGCTCFGFDLKLEVTYKLGKLKILE